jgi:hypothetical protein
MASRRLRLVPDMNGELSPTIPEAAGCPLPHERAVLAATLSDIDSIVSSLLQAGSPLAGPRTCYATGYHVNACNSRFLASSSEAKALS